MVAALGFGAETADHPLYSQPDPLPGASAALKFSRYTRSAKLRTVVSFVPQPSLSSPSDV